MRSRWPSRSHRSLWRFVETPEPDGRPLCRDRRASDRGRRHADHGMKRPTEIQIEFTVALAIVALAMLGFVLSLF